MQDPEIQNILSDPVMRQVRRDELESLSRYLKFSYLLKLLHKEFG